MPLGIGQRAGTGTINRTTASSGKSNLVGALLSVACGGPPTPDNIRGFDAWIQAEKPAGQPMQWNNPMNTTDRWHSSGIYPVGPGISIYPDPATGIMATARTIRGLDGMAGWPRILSSVRKGTLGTDLRNDAAGLLDGWGTSPTLVETILGGNPALAKLGSATTVGTVSGSGGTTTDSSGGTGLTNEADAAGRAVVYGLDWPFKEGADVLETLWKDNPLSAIAAGVLFISNPHNWLRLGMIVGGALTIWLGLVLISWHAFKASGVGQSTISAAKKVAPAAAAAALA
jgi:hypothetical protein